MERNKVPAMMIDGEMIDLNKLTVDELNELKKKIEKKQRETRKQLHDMLGE